MKSFFAVCASLFLIITAVAGVSPATASTKAYRAYYFQGNIQADYHAMTATVPALGSIAFTNTPTGTGGPLGLVTRGTYPNCIQFPTSPWPNNSGAVQFTAFYPYDASGNLGYLEAGTNSDVTMELHRSGGLVYLFTGIPTTGGIQIRNGATFDAVGKKFIARLSVGEGAGTTATLYIYRFNYDTAFVPVESWALPGTPLLAGCPFQLLGGGSAGGTLTWIDNARFYDQPITVTALVDQDFQYPPQYLVYDLGNSLKVGGLGGGCSPAPTNSADRAGAFQEAGVKDLGIGFFGPLVNTSGDQGLPSPYMDAVSGVSIGARSGTLAGSAIARFESVLTTTTAATCQNMIVWMQLNTNNSYPPYGPYTTFTAMAGYDDVLSSFWSLNPAIKFLLVGDKDMNTGAQPGDPTIWNTALQVEAAKRKALGQNCAYLSVSGCVGPLITDGICAGDLLHYTDTMNIAVGKAEIDGTINFLLSPAPAYHPDDRRRRGR